MQGVYGIRKISVEFGVLFNTKNNDSMNYYIEAIGIDNIEKTINMLSKCLNIIKDYYPKCVVKGDEDRIQRLNNLLNKKKGNQKKDKDNRGGNKDDFAQNDERLKEKNYDDNSINVISSLEKKASNAQEASYKHIRTHTIPNNKRNYRIRKKKMKISFFNK